MLSAPFGSALHAFGARTLSHTPTLDTAPSQPPLHTAPSHRPEHDWAHAPYAPRMRAVGQDHLGDGAADLSAAIAQPGVMLEVPDVLLGTQGRVTLRATWVPYTQIRGGDSLELGEDDPDAIDATITEANPDDIATGVLRIVLSRAEGLPAMDKNGKSDPCAVPYAAPRSAGGPRQPVLLIASPRQPSSALADP